MYKIILCLLLSLVVSPICWADNPPNIVLVMADDQGWGDVAYNGHPSLHTPNFDKAAAAGLRFDRFYAAAPVCSPTRASVMTGRHPNRMGVFKWGYPIRPQETTIAEALKTAGYKTAHFGKWHLGSVRNDSPANPGRNGFDYWLSAPNFFDNNPVLCRNGQAEQFEGESSIVTVDAALNWIGKTVDREQPILAVVWFGSPHGPHAALERDKSFYAEQPPRMQNFLGEVTGMDRAFGKLRDGLIDLGAHENTILWYCSDNGGLPKVGSTGGHRGAKGSIYDGGLLVPAFVEWPVQITEPRKSTVRCNTCDIYPTLLDIVGLSTETDAPIDGVSLLPLFNGKAFTRTKPMGFWDYATGGKSVPSDKLMTALLKAQKSGTDLAPGQPSRDAATLPKAEIPDATFVGHAAWLDGDWKLHRIENKNGQVQWELYNLENDPNETKDEFARHIELSNQLKIDLEAWLASVVDSYHGSDY